MSRIGRFEVQRPVGSGSFATVWLARDEDLDGWVAIKLLAENWSFNQDARRRFIEEARALRRLDSDRIVRVYDVGQLPDSRPYIVMEYADRGSLEDRMRLRSQLDQRFSVHEALALGVEIAECLISVHDHRIVHRDVKPSNILFRSVPRERQEALRRDARPVPRERTLLGDFGIARRLEGPLGHTMVVGSPQYMAPEQADPDRAGLVDYRSDIYSAAVILYELLCWHLPFASRSMSELDRVEPAARPVSLERLRPEVPPMLAAAVGKALARDPGERFTSAWEWREALKESGRALLASGASGASQPGPGAPASRTPPAAAGGSLPSNPGEVIRTAPLPSVRGAVTTTAPAPPRRDTAVLPAATAPSRPVPASPAARIAPARGPVAQSEESEPPPGSEPASGRPAGLGVRVPATLALASGAALLASVLLPWAKITGDFGVSNRLGLRFAAGNLTVICGLVLLLVGLRLWRGRRRWVGSFVAFLGLVSGLAATGIAAFELVAVDGQVLARPGSVSFAFGLFVSLGGGALASVACSAALRKMRRARQAERLAAVMESIRNR